MPLSIIRRGSELRQTLQFCLSLNLSAVKIALIKGVKMQFAVNVIFLKKFHKFHIAKFALKARLFFFI